MKRMTKKDWRSIIGYNPGSELKKKILQRVHDEKMSIQEAASIYAIPPLIIDGIDNKDDYDNEYRPAVYIKLREN